MAGSTLRQERLAEALLDPTVKSKAEALIRAGYSPATAHGNPGRQVGLVGTKRALERVKADRLDSAAEMREAAGIAIKVARADIEDMGARDRLLTAAALFKAAAEIPAAPVDAKAELDDFALWKQRFRRVVWYLAMRSLRAQPMTDAIDAIIVER